MDGLSVEPDKCIFHADESGRVIHIGANDVRWEHQLRLLEMLQLLKYCNPAIQSFHWRLIQDLCDEDMFRSLSVVIKNDHKTFRM